MPNIGDSLPHSILRTCATSPIFAIVNIGGSDPYGTWKVYDIIPDISYLEYRGFARPQHIGFRGGATRAERDE